MKLPDAKLNNKTGFQGEAKMFKALMLKADVFK